MKSSSRWRPAVFPILIVVMGMLVYALILVNRYPFPLRPISLTVQFGFTLMAPLTAPGLYLAYRLPGTGWPNLPSHWSSHRLKATALSSVDGFLARPTTSAVFLR